LTALPVAEAAFPVAVAAFLPASSTVSRAALIPSATSCEAEPLPELRCAAGAPFLERELPALERELLAFGREARAFGLPPVDLAFEPEADFERLALAFFVGALVVAI